MSSQITALWPLMQSELERLQPLLAPLAETELDPAAFKLRQRHCGELCAALSMVGAHTGIERAVKWLRAVHQDAGVLQANQAPNQLWQDAIFTLAVGADASTALASFTALTQSLPVTPSAAPKTVRPVPAAADLAVASQAGAQTALAQTTAQAESATNSKAADSVDARLLTLFVSEVEDKTAAIQRWLLKLEQNPEQTDLIAPLMRAAHSLKGAARAVGNDAIVKTAHAFEDRMSAAQKANVAVGPGLLQLALDAVDLIKKLAVSTTPEALGYVPILQRLESYHDDAIEQATRLRQMAQVYEGAGGTVVQSTGQAVRDSGSKVTAHVGDSSAMHYIDVAETDPQLRVRASVVGRIIRLAGRQMLQAQHLDTFLELHLQARRELLEISGAFDQLRGRYLRALTHHGEPKSSGSTVLHSEEMEQWQALHQRLADAKQHALQFAERFGEQVRRNVHLSEQLYHLSGTIRLRPFEELAASYLRMVRDLARATGKQVALRVLGGQTQVDRDVLEQLDAPLTHLINNAIDHGLEMPEQRRATNKLEEGTVYIRASYAAARLLVEVSDDGAGIDPNKVREHALRSGRYEAEQVATWNEAAVYDYLLQAGVSTRTTVTEISGRGVGLDVVYASVRALGGNLQIQSKPGFGTKFLLSLPISRAVVRALVVQLGQDCYALPLARISKVAMTRAEHLITRDGLQYWQDQERLVALSALSEHLGLGATDLSNEQIPLLVLSHLGQPLAFVVEKILGEFDLSISESHARLGRIADVAGWSVLPNGAPVVVLDADDLTRGAANLSYHLKIRQKQNQLGKRLRRVLVADDSISVRELERQLLAAHGYEVDVATDGAQAWNKLREGNFDLLITDVDMPRLDGIELTKSVKQDIRLKHLPVIIVSYRDRQEDRQRGLDARADAYLTKGDFQDDRFMHIVSDLIGPPEVAHDH